MDLTGRFLYHSKLTLENIRTNPLGTFFTFFVMTTCLFLLGISFTFFCAGKHLLPWWSMDRKAVVYLRAETTQQELEALAGELKSWKGIQQVAMVSRDEARKRLGLQLGEWKAILESIPDDVVPPSLDVVLSEKTDSPEEVDALFEKIRKFPQVEETFYGKAWSEKLDSYVKPIRLLWLWVMSLVATIAVMVVFNTTRLTLAARREEMEICCLLGATRLFKAAPFCMESILMGILSGLLALCLVAYAVVPLRGSLPTPMAGAISLQGVEVFALAVGLPVSGMVFGLGGSWLALRRALRLDVSSFGS